MYLLYVLKKGLTSSNSIQSETEGKTLMSPIKRNPSSSSDAGTVSNEIQALLSSDTGTVSEEMELWNPLQLNFILSSLWVNSNFLHIEDSNVEKSVSYNEGNARPHSCMYDAVNVGQDCIDQTYAVPRSSFPFPEVAPATIVDEFADFFNFIPYTYYRHPGTAFDDD